MFLVTFAKLGDDWNLEEQFFNTRSLCCLFGSKKKSIDIVWPDMLMKKINVKTKWLVYQICHYYIHMPYQIQLTAPASEAPILIARIWKFKLSASLSLPNITDHRWNKDRRIKWIQPFPDVIAELLMFDNGIEVYGSDSEQDSEENERRG